MIELRGVERFYQAGPTRTYVLRQIDLRIQEGEFVTIMGPSGAGKSSLLSILGMLDHSWSGEYDFLGGQSIRSRRASGWSSTSARSGSCSRSIT